MANTMINSLVLNSDIQANFKKFLLLFRQAEIVFVIVWFLDHFTIKPFPSVNDVWIIAFVSDRHAWITKSEPLLMFFQPPVLTWTNVVLMPLFPFFVKHNTSMSLRLSPLSLPLASLETLNKDIFIIILGLGEVNFGRWAGTDQ